MSEVQVNKGDVCWFELSVGRNSKGLDIFVKADVKLEEFFKGQMGQSESVSIYGREWINSDPDKDLETYKISKSLTSASMALTYTLTEVSTPLESLRDGRINLSFLRLVGISNPGGIRFSIAGPYSKDYIKRISTSIGKEVREFVKEYVVPVHVNLRITSQDV